MRTEIVFPSLWILFAVLLWCVVQFPLNLPIVPVLSAACAAAVVVSIGLTAINLSRTQPERSFLRETRWWWVCSLLSLLVVAPLIPGYFEVLGKKKNEAVKENMRLVQSYVEQFAQDHKGIYPSNIEDFKSYFPGGSPPLVTGKPLINPFSPQSEWPVLGEVKDVSAARKTPPSGMGEGTIEYSPLSNGAGTTNGYAIRGGGYGQRAIGPRYLNVPSDGTLVLSNLQARVEPESSLK